jgi:hypothetical protein
MKFLKVLALIALVLSATACSRVAPNNVGVLMENYGKEGKVDFSLQKGRVWTFAPGTELFQVPLWEQRGGANASLVLKAADNTEFKSRPVYSYEIIENRAIDVVFDNKHLGTGADFMKALEDNILDVKIYDIMKETSRKYLTNDLMADSGSLMLEKAVEELVREEFLKRGIKLITFSAQLEFSKAVTDKIDNRNEVNTNIGVLDQKIAEQRKQNELEELVKQQNLLRSAGITPQLLQQQFIEKWDGHTPLYGNLPITLLKKE